MPGLFELHAAVTLELEVASAPPTPAGDLVVRELGAGELDRVLAAAELLVARSATVGRRPWRSFVVWAGGEPIHHTFVTFATPVPRLFKVFTHAAHRRRGAFRAAVGQIARELHAGGHTILHSSCNGANAPSLRAHQRAGFRPIRVRYTPYVLGVPLDPLGRALGLLGCPRRGKSGL